MKLRKIAKKTFLGVIISIILLTNLVSTNYAQVSKNNNDYVSLKDDLIPHDEIIITTDEGFGPLGYNFPGIGLPGDPYLIENYNITTGGPFGILIDASGGGNSFNVSFIIRNCWISAVEVCIKIVDAYPNLVTIDNCVCINTIGGDGVGIFLVRCDGATVINCTCYNNFHTGIRLDMCAGLWIENNNCTKNGDKGLFIDNASDNGLFLNNTCEDNAWGITNQFSHSNTFRYNNCTDNTYTGYGFYYSNWLVVENNTAYKNDDFGFQILSSDNGLLKFNLIEETRLYGVYLEASVDFYTLHHNNFIGNNAGGTSQAEDAAIYTTQNATWYDTAKNEGNYWDDYIGPGVYNIDGTANNFDPYPLGSPVVIISEYSYTVWCLILISFIGLGTIFLRKK